MERPRPPVLAALAALLALGACAGAPEPGPARAGGDGFPVSLEDCGTTVEVAAAPERAVTMNQGATEVALALGLEDRLVGTAYLDDDVPEEWREAYASVEVLSDEYPDQESLLEADPDLVYASYTSAFDDEEVASRAELADLGVATYTSPLGCRGAGDPVPVTFDSVWDEVDDVAAAFGVPDRARALRAEQEAALERLGRQRPGAGTDVFWFDSGDRTAFAGAGGGGPQLVLDAVGATNVFADVEGGWADVPWEDVVAADPDVIVLADAAWSSAAEKKAFLAGDPVLRDLRAVREERYVVLPYSESTPGVRLVDGAARVAEQLAALR